MSTAKRSRRSFVKAAVVAPIVPALLAVDSQASLPAANSDALQPLDESAKVEPAAQPAAVEIFVVTITDDKGARTVAVSLDRSAMESYVAKYNGFARGNSIADMQAVKVEPKPRGVARMAIVERPKGWRPTDWQSIPRGAKIIRMGEPMNFRTARGATKVFNEELAMKGPAFADIWAIVVENDRKLA